MQIVYVGFAGSAAIEAEAGVQLLRLERFSPVLAGCHLAIELLSRDDALPTYDAQLDLLFVSRALKPIRHCRHEIPQLAIVLAFDVAERNLMSVGPGVPSGRRSR